MKQLFFVKKEKLEWREVDLPKITGPQEALVRPFAVAKCDLDDFYLFDNIIPKIRIGKLLGIVDPAFNKYFGEMISGPFAFGHECVAEVVEIGDKVTHVKIGDVVSVPFQLSCGSCINCTHGITSSCNSFPALSTYGLGIHKSFGGAMSDIIKVPYADAMLLKIPTHINPIHLASLSDNVPDAYRAIGPYLEGHPEKTVLILGGRPRSIGLYAVLIAKSLGAKEIVYVDTINDDLDLAKKLGADICYNSLDKIKDKYDIVVEALSSTKSLTLALKSVKNYGVCTSVGIYPKKTTLPLVDMYVNGINYKTGLTNARTDAEKVLRLINEKKIDLSIVTTKLETWDNAIEAFLSKASKVIVTRDRMYNK
jgi:Threonine dehydrogenase and related Zn-dependent dehydrogenases